MSVRIEYLPSQSHAPWVVHFGTKRVQFQDEKSAQDYAATLKDRIDAPHAYPIPSQERSNLSAHCRQSSTNLQGIYLSIMNTEG